MEQFKLTLPFCEQNPKCEYHYIDTLQPIPPLAKIKAECLPTAVRRKVTHDLHRYSRTELSVLPNDVKDRITVLKKHN